MNYLEPLGGAAVTTLGEAMLRLTAGPGVRLADAPALDVFVAGAEANVAAGLAQLGVSTRWVSRLPSGPLGRRVEHELAALGVRTDAIEWADEGIDRLGLFFAEPGSGARAGSVLYDRVGSAFAGMDRLPPRVAEGTSIVHLTGITPALGPGPAALARELVKQAERVGALVSFDVNYRSLLWSQEQARDELLWFVERSHILFCPERDARAVLGLSGDAESVVTALAGLADEPRLVVMTRGELGSLAHDSRGVAETHAPTAGPVVDRFGMGDALVAGVLWGVLAGDHGLALRAGSALAAWKGSLSGDLLRIQLSDLHDLLAGTREGMVR